MPGSANAIRAGKAYVELGTDNNPLSRGLSAAQRRLTAFGASIRGFGAKLIGIGTLLAAPLAAASIGFATTGEKLVELSARTGMTVEALSELAYAADQVGLSSEGFEAGVRKMQKFTVAAAKGGQEARETLMRLGITIGQLGNMTPEEQLDLFADKIAAIHDPAVKSATAMEIFGKGGAAMLPLLEKGSAGIEALRKQAAEFGLTIATRDAEAAAKFGRALKLLWKIVDVGVFSIGSALVGAQGQFIERVQAVLAAAVKWIKSHQELILAVAKLALGVVALGVGIYALGTFIGGVAPVFRILSFAMNLVVAAGTMVVGILGAILSPAGIAVGVVVALGAAFLSASGVAGKAVGRISGALQGMKADATAGFQGIADALAAGNIDGAASVLWATLKVIWQRGANALSGIWEDLKDSVYGIVVGMGTKLASAGAAITYVLKTAWIGLTTAISKAWAWMMMGMQRGWNSFSGYFRKKWIDLKSLVDSSVHFEAEKAAIDQEGLAEANAIGAEYEKKIHDLDEGKDKGQKDIEAANAEAFKAIDQGDADRRAQRPKDRDANLKASLDALDAAKRERDAAIAAAGKKPEMHGGEDLGFRAKSANHELEELQHKFSVEGTFSAAGVRGLAGRNVNPQHKAQERAAKALEAGVKILEKIEANTQRQIAFASTC